MSWKQKVVESFLVKFVLIRQKKFFAQVFSQKILAGLMPYITKCEHSTALHSRDITV